MNLFKNFLLSRPSFGVMVNRAAGLLAFSLVAVVLVEFFVPSPSQATLPVIDYAAVGHLVEQTAQFTQHLSMMAQQIALLKQQIQSLKGNYGMGNLTKEVNTWGSSGWDDIVGMVKTGANPGDASQVAAYKAAREKYLAAYPRLDVPLQPSHPRLRTSYVANYQAAMTGLSAGQSTFNNVTAQLAELQKLKDAIERTPTVKAALDLNTAVGIKNAQINAELLRTQAVGVYLQANSQNAATNGQAAQAEFFAR